MTISASVADQLNAIKHRDLCQSARTVITGGGKKQRQENHKKALVELHKAFENALVEAIVLRFALHEGQAKRLRYKKDRIKILKQHGIDYLTVDGVETAHVLAAIAHSIIHEDGIVTADLNDVFPFWKQGFPMVQYDNAYKILAEDIHIHLQLLIDQLLD